MFKKLLSLAIVMMMIMSMAAVAASAAQVELVDNAAETPAEVGAEGGADTGAEGGAETGSSNKIYFDASTSGWNEGTYTVVSIYLYVPETGEILIEWGSKKKGGMTNEGNNIWSFDFDQKGLSLDSSVQYSVIFLNDIGLQTCDLLMDTTNFGDTAVCEADNFYENTDDSNKKSTVVRWKSGHLGPKKAVTSLGHIVGEVVPAFTSPYKMFVEFLANSGAKSMTNAMQYANGKTAQEIIDEAGASLGLKRDDVKQAINEAATTGTVTAGGTETCDWSKEWDESKSSLPSGESEDAHQTGDGGTDDSKGGSGGSGGSGNSGSGSENGSGNSGSGSSGSSSGSSGGSSSASGSSGGSSASGSGDGSKTGQDTTVLFIMLGVMIVAAGAIVIIRKKIRS